ncbi:hypothetical protein [Stenotrophomonas maltophilia]|uniref:hypothetical protein n=1 Tax=Stenotrophomonas maltophilia TaxID=40324 RepID=UPI001A9C4FD7|nr:hypothetical protein [Stenotrophomonas maltophilia]
MSGPLKATDAPLSAQPSPGGQDAPFPWENFPAYLIDKCEGDTISEEGLQQALAAMAKDERYCLAARQPVGEGWSGWATQYAGKMPKLYGAREIAELNHYPDEGQRLIFLTEQPAQAVDLGQTFQAHVAEWMGQCFLPSLYSNMTERGDRLLEEVLELLQAHGYDKARVPTLVDYVFGRPVGEPAQEVGGVMVTLAGYCWVAGLDMHAAGDAELARINQPDVMAKIRAKQEAKNALHFDTPLPGYAALTAQAVDLADFKALYRAYVRLLESGRDRIRDLGGACDPVDVMEANDVDLQAARRVIDSQAVGNG